MLIPASVTESEKVPISRFRTTRRSTEGAARRGGTPAARSRAWWFAGSWKLRTLLPYQRKKNLVPLIHTERKIKMDTIDIHAVIRNP